MNKCVQVIDGKQKTKHTNRTFQSCFKINIYKTVEEHQIIILINIVTTFYLVFFSSHAPKISLTMH